LRLTCLLIQSVYTSLAGLGQAPAPVEEKREPAVSVRSSVKADSIACLECGAKMKMLKRHLSTDHSLSPTEYRTRWNLAADYPMVAPDYAAKRKELAVKIGLGRKPSESPKAAAKPKMRGRKKLGLERSWSGGLRPATSCRPAIQRSGQRRGRTSPSLN
jgi:predicted transcriptional regulator